MTQTFDILIVGAGPAGMSAAIRATQLGLSTLVVDEQPAPGGQIWRAIESNATRGLDRELGAAYSAGAAVVREFRLCGAHYRNETRVWQIERANATDRATDPKNWIAYMSGAGGAEGIQVRNVLLATGAQERPMPFVGWTLPGVMTVGAAQILHKTAHQIPEHPVWVAGSGPLPLLYMTQLLDAGGRIAGWLDTTPGGAWRRSIPVLRGAAEGWRDLLKGLLWSAKLRGKSFPIVRRVNSLQAFGIDRLEQIVYRTESGQSGDIAADMLLVHEGVVPSIHFTQAMGCSHRWNERQLCFEPELNTWGGASMSGLYVAGDGAGIGGAKAACTRGELAAIGVAVALGALSAGRAGEIAAPLRRRLEIELATRPLLDSVYRPRSQIFTPSDEAIVCRCEEVTAAEVRAAAQLGQPGPNQVKAFTRAGMGPCQGRQCGYTVANLLASTQCRSVADVGFQRVRPPLKPVTLAEISSLREP
ncbi:FAD/NAD(P)-binding oxidoreductase (plasmid) [Burkholderia sp. JP2-270]|uniref:FAD/NAD(P)-dependent oxidoreductase n=1 Tax=Burkholderia sp. JP2-270 TaxID=2217913 RepID=UPI000DA35218|nr:NAD(P)/FAD-dependent oxidoreductase [Burkholderia sp. JP2-270]AWV05621.1 FAD/NAD(P)-binding oxidoreductase [Burkholderia sp. JP2-270]